MPLKPLHILVHKQLGNSSLENNIVANDEFIDVLYEKSVVTEEEKETIESLLTNHERIRQLLKILDTKEDKYYEAFKTCLQETKNNHVINILTECENKVENDFKTTEDVLQYNYKEVVEGCVRLEEITSLLIKHFRKDDKWLECILNNEILVSVVQRIFPKTIFKTIECNKHGKRHNRSIFPSTETVISGLSSNQDLDLLSDKSGENVSSDESDSDQETSIKVANRQKLYINLNVNEFASWIENVLDRHNSSENSSTVSKFKKEQIDGAVFDSMSRDELEAFIPSFGERRKVMIEWGNLKACNLETKTTIENVDNINDPVVHCHYRKFDKMSSAASTKYYKNGKLPDISTRPGNLLSPVHYYFMLEEGSKTEDRNISVITKEIVRFGCACLNERTNGVIHIGVSANGIVHGVALSQKAKLGLDTRITKCIRRFFYEPQVATSLNCIRPPQFVEILGTEHAGHYVIEVDVVPSYKIVDDQTFFIKGQQRDELLRFENGIVCMDVRRTEQYMQHEKKHLQEKRMNIEKLHSKGRKKNLNKIIRDFLCNGGDKIDRSNFLLLVISEIHKDMYADADFISCIPWNAIFDFNARDEMNSIQVYLEKCYNMAYNTNNVADFDRKKVGNDKILAQTFQTLNDSSITNWIYCNEQLISEPNTWRYELGDSFRNSLEFYSDKIHKGKGRVIIPIFSVSNDILLEGAVEILIKFRDQCLILCPSDSISVAIKEALQRRNAFPPNSNIDSLFLVGLPWAHIKECISKLVDGSDNCNDMEIPRSNGVPCIIPQKIKRELSEIEILASNACADIQYMSDKKRSEKERQEAEDFYGGGVVTWTNLYFKKQVLVRDVNNELNSLVYDSLEGRIDDEDDPIKRVMVYHQPGSGGSTTSRQILWNMKDHFRCCVVKNITKQTAAQITRFRNHDENQEEARPVLVLTDTSDEKLIKQLYDDLEVESQNVSCSVFCVLLICLRVSDLPLEKPKCYVMLQQKLSNIEHNWFKTTYKGLLDKHKKRKGCDPKTLLAFNIMKENFDTKAIEHSVLEFVRDDSIRPDYRTMLKYLAFFNAYDISFAAVPVVCFDPIMQLQHQWVGKLSHAMRVLISIEQRRGLGGTFPAVRISNYLLAKPVLKAVLEFEKERGRYAYSLGEVAASIFKSSCFSKTYNKSVPYTMLLNISANIMTKREFTAEKQNAFAPMIMELHRQNDTDACIGIFHLVYNLTNDTGVTQQLARFYGELGNWVQAHAAIDEVTDEKSENPYFIHTKGYLYQSEFRTNYVYTIDKQSRASNLTLCEIERAIDLVKLSVSFFRKVQELSVHEKVFAAGYISEALIIVDLLEVLDNVPELRPIFNLLSDPDNFNISLSKESRDFLQQIPRRFCDAIEMIEKDLYGMNKHPISGGKGYIMHKKQLETCKTKYSTITSGTESLSRLRPIQIYSLSGTVSSKRYVRNKDIQCYLEKRCSLNDRERRIFLIACLQILTYSETCIVDPKTLLEESRRLYDNRTCGMSTTAILEAHLFFVGLHWPLRRLKDELKDDLCNHSVLCDALKSWDKIVMELPESYRKVDKILFYLGDKCGFPFLLRNDCTDVNSFLKFKGTVVSNGLKVAISLPGFYIENAARIEIMFYRRVRRSVLWNRDQEIVIGFGLHGPKAELVDKTNGPTSLTKVRQNDFQETPQSNPFDTENYLEEINSGYYSGNFESKTNSNCLDWEIPSKLNVNWRSKQVDAMPHSEDHTVKASAKFYFSKEQYNASENISMEIVNPSTIKNSKMFEESSSSSLQVAMKEFSPTSWETLNSTTSSTVEITRESKTNTLQNNNEPILSPQWQWSSKSFQSSHMSNEGSLVHESMSQRPKISIPKSSPTKPKLVDLSTYLPLPSLPK